MEASLVAQQRALKNQLAANRHALKALEDKRRKSVARASRFGLGLQAVKSVLAAYVFSGHRASLAAVLAQKLYKKKESDEEIDWQRAVEDLYLAASMEDLQKLDDGSEPASVKAASVARSFLAKAAVSDWVVEQNFRHGVAPDSFQVRQHYQVVSGQNDTCDTPVVAAASSSLRTRAFRRWAQRWAKTWGFKQGRLRRQEDLPDDEVAEKARAVGWKCSCALAV